MPCRNGVLRPVHTVRFFHIASAIPLLATNGLYGTQRKCSHYETVGTSPVPIQPIVSKNKSQLQVAQCKWTLKSFVLMRFITRNNICNLSCRYIIVIDIMST